MPYEKIKTLERHWHILEAQLTLSGIEANRYHLPEIQQLMTATYVIDLTKHAIYLYTSYVHGLTRELLNLRNNNPDDEGINNSCRLWTDLLTHRNQHPLKIMHHKALDGLCRFDFSLKMIMGKPYGFKEIQILDPNNVADLNAAIQSIKYLDCLAHGFNFGDLYFIDDTVISSLLTYQHTLCFLAKDVNNEIIGYCWGFILPELSVDEKDKANLFWVMNLARNPDFYDPHVKVGTILRQCMADTFKAKADCHFIGYGHKLNHSFHADIIDGGLANKSEKINIGENQYQAKSNVKYNSTDQQFFRHHIIRINNNHYPFPKMKCIRPAVIDAFKQSSQSMKEFLVGGMLFLGQSYIQQLTHSMLAKPQHYRIEEPIATQQHACDMAILKMLIFSDQWHAQNKKLFAHDQIPPLVQNLRQLTQDDPMENNAFSLLKKTIEEQQSILLQSKLETHFYSVITKNSNPRAAIDSLLHAPITPKKWVLLIDDERQKFSMHNNQKYQLHLS